MRMIRWNFQSDMVYLETFYERQTDGTLLETTIPGDEVDFILEYRADGSARFRATRIDGVYTNCRRVNDYTVEVFIPLSGAGLGKGELERKLLLSYPDDNFPETTKNICVPTKTGYFLWHGPSDGGSQTAQGEAILSQIIVDKNKPLLFTFDHGAYRSSDPAISAPQVEIAKQIYAAAIAGENIIVYVTGGYVSTTYRDRVSGFLMPSVSDDVVTGIVESFKRNSEDDGETEMLFTVMLTFHVDGTVDAEESSRTPEFVTKDGLRYLIPTSAPENVLRMEIMCRAETGEAPIGRTIFVKINGSKEALDAAIARGDKIVLQRYRNIKKIKREPGVSVDYPVKYRRAKRKYVDAVWAYWIDGKINPEDRVEFDLPSTIDTWYPLQYNEVDLLESSFVQSVAQIDGGDVGTFRGAKRRNFIYTDRGMSVKTKWRFAIRTITGDFYPEGSVNPLYDNREYYATFPVFFKKQKMLGGDNVYVYSIIER